MNKFAIIVTFEPNISHLEKLCLGIFNQGFSVIIVDNSEMAKLKKASLNTYCTVLYNNENMGIAYSQNIGIKHADSLEAEIITFFDQDSIISDDLLEKLVSPIFYNKLLITLPVSINISNGDEYPSQVINKLGWPSDIYLKEKSGLTRVDIGISSGTTTNIETFKKIGFFDEDFFIDFVDIEWFIRAKKKGVLSCVVPSALMTHSIGNSTTDFGPFQITVHSPIRTYYKIRNSFLLFRKDISFLFCLRQIIPALLQNFILLFIVKQKSEYFKYYILGIFHGIVNKRGKLS